MEQIGGPLNMRLERLLSLLIALAPALTPACAVLPGPAPVLATAHASLTVSASWSGQGVKRIQAIMEDVARLRVKVTASDGTTYEGNLLRSETNGLGDWVSFPRLPAGSAEVFVQAFDAMDKQIGSGVANSLLKADQANSVAVPVQLIVNDKVSLVEPRHLGTIAPLPDTSKIIERTLTETILALAPATDGGVWAQAKTTLVKLGADGIVQASVVDGSSFFYDLAVDDRNHAWVASTVLREYAPAGTLVRQVEVVPPGGLSYGYATQVSVGSGNVVWFAYDRTLCKLSSDGQVLARFEAGAPIVQLHADHSSGNVWLVTENQAVRQLDADGRVLAALELPQTQATDGRPLRDTIGISSLFVQAGGSAWLTSLNGQKLTQLSTNAALVAEYPTGARPVGCALDGNGDVWIASRTNAPQNLLKLASDGSWLGTLTVPGTPGPVTTDADGYVWVAADKRLFKLAR